MTLEGAGVQFIPENGGGPGVRLKASGAGGGMAIDNLNASSDE